MELSKNKNSFIFFLTTEQYIKGGVKAEKCFMEIEEVVTEDSCQGLSPAGP